MSYATFGKNQSSLNIIADNGYSSYMILCDVFILLFIISFKTVFLNLEAY